jgi:hypothetical protein
MDQCGCALVLLGIESISYIVRLIFQECLPDGSAIMHGTTPIPMEITIGGLYYQVRMARSYMDFITFTRTATSFVGQAVQLVIGNGYLQIS